VYAANQEAKAMFMTAGLAAVFIGIKLLIGCVIGLAVVAVIYRARFGVGLAIRGALFSALAFLIVSGLAGWAGSHAAFQNGHRMDVAPWGEDLWLRNRIAENEGLLCIASSIAAALLAGVRLRGTQRRPAR
jgi:hypothetical protein